MRETSINGVPTDGAIAYKEGYMAGECPYMEEDDLDFNRWNAEWDAAADEHELEVARPKGPGSIITNRYRAKYSEYGHPTHCGDELAELLNNLCSNKAGTNIELFEAICAANGVHLTKYNRTNKGWQGRLRMTGRNLLARKVRDQDGVILMPKGTMPDHYQLSTEWVEEAVNKYKPKPLWPPARGAGQPTE